MRATMADESLSTALSPARNASDVDSHANWQAPSGNRPRHGHGRRSVRLQKYRLESRAGRTTNMNRHLVFASCEAGLANQDGPSTHPDLVRFAQLGGGRLATGDPQRTIASLVPDAIDLAIGLATMRTEICWASRGAGSACAGSNLRDRPRHGADRVGRRTSERWGGAQAELALEPEAYPRQWHRGMHEDVRAALDVCRFGPGGANRVRAPHA